MDCALSNWDMGEKWRIFDKFAQNHMFDNDLGAFFASMGDKSHDFRLHICYSCYVFGIICEKFIFLQKKRCVMFSSLFKTTSSRNLLGILLLCLAGVGQAFAAWDGTSKVQPSMEGGYYIIDTEAKLAWYGANYNKGNAKLTADLDLGGHLWIPLAAGKGDKYYSKIFDGQNHIIKNLYVNGDELSAINKEYAQNLGFVGVLGDGKVLNLVLENVDIQATTNAGTIITNQDNQISVGAVVGWMSDKGTNVVDNCITSGTIKTTGKSQGVGGIVGNAKKGTISNCMSLVEIQTSGSKAYVGGIIGITKTEVTVTSCVYAGPGLMNTGSEGSVGGITGNVWSGTMTATDSYYEGEGLTYQGNAVSGVGKTCKDCTVNDTTVNTSEINEDSIACALNGIDTTTGACKTEPWSVGETSLSLNGYGADGYKIVFDANGGAFANGKADKNKFLDGGMAITADEIENPSRENYSFAGWAKTRDAAVPAADLGTVSKSDTVFAVWTPVYTVTFNVAPGVFPESNDSVKTKQVTSGETITVEGLGTLPSSRCKNYVSGSEDECETWSYFTGWALTAGAHESDSVSLDTVTASDELVLHAVWTDVETYTVTYNANQHGRTTVDYVRVGAGDTVSAPTDPIANDGYVFAGWFTDSNGVNEYEFTSQITQSIILYAKWTLQRFNISYVMNEGTDTGDNPGSYTIDTSFALKAPADIEGYEFEGWFYDAAFTNKATQVIPGTTGDKTFYGKWSKKTYRIMYLADNNSYGSISDQFVEHGTTITLESAGIFRRAGYEQNGWSTTMGGAKGYELGEEYTVVAPVTLYPSWSLATYTITYECDGCVNDPTNPTTYTYNDQKGIRFAQAPEGYSFAGWFKEPDFQTQVTQIVKKSYGNITLYGKQLKVYTITYVGTDNAYGDKTYTSEKAALLRTCAPRAGYTFAGWYDNPDFEGDAVTEVPLGSTGDKTFYAKWTPEAYPIVYHNIEGATFETENPETYTVEDGNIDLNSPSKTGYNFLGWFVSEDTEEPVAGIAAGSTGEAHFYAKWEKVYPFLVGEFGAIKVFENADGSKTAQINTNSSETVEIPSDVSVNHVEFVRKFTVGKNSTIMLPFSIDTTKISGGSFKEFAYVDESVPKAVFYNDVAGGVIQANTPYIFVPTSDTLIINIADGDSVILNTNNITVPVSEKDGGKWQFRGVYSRIDWPSGNKQAWGFVANNSPEQEKVGKFKRAGTGAYIVPLRGYLYNTQPEEQTSVQQSSRRLLAKAAYVSAQTASISNGSGSNSMEVDFIEREVEAETEAEVEETTVISKVKPISGEIKAINGWFDMKGRKLNAKPTTKGIYYFNGKQVMVR
ncbi:MAG: InlB B-repeat-containing protein [Fibrobacter sp.]|uniref:InlB B-repeat-containing protein n=1 Tax=Fibrobacter sp. TaxID=35828 RepID=UPI0025C5F4B7|nr:InlB B-repeat-containing protein [Fibrobacter sp.]MBR4785621.1 InlB B-repeat-containing protein [Fibrobacter sp.]